MKLRFAFFLLLVLAVAAVPAMAQTDLYDNGPVDGQDLGFTLNFGFSVSDSFTLGSSATVTGASFWAWLIPGDTLTSIEFQIGAAAFGNELLDQTLNLTAANCFSNQFGYTVCDETATFSGGGVNLSAGTWWMTLSNASVPSGDPAYWDMNSGPSQAQENTIGTIPSESFTMWGAGTTSSTTCSGCGCGNNPTCGPEPGSFLLLGSGVLGIGAMLWMKLRWW